MASSCSRFHSIPDLPPAPHQPTASFVYSKRAFGKKNVVWRSFQQAWFKQWTWLHYDEANDVAYCHLCVSALKQKKMKQCNAKPSFLSTGFSNWKDATVAFKKHHLSACHHSAVDVMITIPATTRDIGEQLSQIHSQEKATNRRMFLKILSSIRYLARQGLALRGDGDEHDGNFLQLLKLKGEDDPAMIDWLKRKANKYTSHQSQNNILRIMAMNVLREVTLSLQQSPFITLMMDETTDISNKEQSVMVLRWVSEDFEVNEEFLGLYHVPSIDAATLTIAAKDTLCRMNVPLSKLRGQCYDGASAMSGAKSGVAKRIREEEPRAVYTHCYGHSVNLATCDAIKESKPIKSALETTHEITKLIKFSPRREGVFKQIKSSCDATGDSHSPGLRVLAMSN